MKLILFAVYFVTTIAALTLGFISGATRRTKLEIDNSIEWGVISLNLLDGGETNRLRNITEDRLAWSLIARDNFDKSLLHLPSAFHRRQHGSTWDMHLEWAEARVKTQRSDWDIFFSDPEEAAKRLAKVMSDRFEETGRSNITVNVRRTDNESIELKLENWE